MKKAKILVIAILLIIGIFSVMPKSLSALKQVLTLTLPVVTDGTNSIDLISLTPIEDEEIVSYLPYVYTISNETAELKKYNIYMSNDSSKYIDCISLDDSILKISVSDEVFELTSKRVNDKYLIATIEVPANSTINTEIKVWIKSETEANLYTDKHFHGTISHEEVITEEVTTSPKPSEEPTQPEDESLDLTTDPNEFMDITGIA